jgi:protein ImuB
MRIPLAALRRRFGPELIKRLHQALGKEIEPIEFIRPLVPYEERLPSLEPIRTATGIEIGLRTLLERLCQRLGCEQKGLRKCILRCYRVDGVVKQIEIGTNQPSRNLKHLFKLFENKIVQIEPGFGLELFVLEASIVEDLEAEQDALWRLSSSNETAIAELIDRLTGRTGAGTIRRYLPQEHYWPEHSIKATTSLIEKPSTAWNTQRPRPVYLLTKPESIEVSVPIPDYPPMLFIYKGQLHTVKKADGPERIEQEWWIQTGLYRDYYCVEDDRGRRYWLFRSGDYNEGLPKWFIHGFFA